jgi:hypothetical protein
MSPGRRFYLILPLMALTLAAVTVAMASPAGQSGPASLTIDPADFSTNITNPFFPLSTLGPKVFEGEEVDPDTGEVIATRVESQALPDTITVAGVEVLVLEERAYQNGELVEVSLDYLAQHSDGTVYYFGEHVDNYIMGVIDNNDGSWLAGEGVNEPGIIMPAAPFVGQTYAQEIAPGIAEDQGEVVALGQSVKVTAGVFTGCVLIKDTNPLELPIVEEFKLWCPGVGLVSTVSPDAFEELISFSTTGGGTPTATPFPTPNGSPAPTASPFPTPNGSPTPSPGGSPAPTGTAAATPTPTPVVDDQDKDDEDVDEPGDVDEGDDDDDDGEDDEDEGDDEDEDDEDDDEDEDEEGEDDD